MFTELAPEQWGALFPDILTLDRRLGGRATIFPLWPVVDGACPCGAPACDRIGKHPRVAWGQLGAAEKVFNAAGDGGHGLATGERSACFVVDCDTVEAYEALAARLPATFSVATARGVHLYFKWPG
jgi:hypothetical protein